MGKSTERLGIEWIHLVICQIPEEKFGREKLGRHNITKIDNPIFGVLQTHPSNKTKHPEIKLSN
jgi:hypothetical protein